MCASTGKFNLEKLSLGNVDENEDEDCESKEPKKQTTKKPIVRCHTDSHIGSKRRGGSIKKTDSKSSLNGLTTSGVQKKLVARSISHK